MPIVPFS